MDLPEGVGPPLVPRAGLKSVKIHGEDAALSSSSHPDGWSLFAVADGHNGCGAAACCKAFLPGVFRNRLGGSTGGKAGSGGSSSRAVSPKARSLCDGGLGGGGTASSGGAGRGPSHQAVKRALAQAYMALDHSFCASAPSSGCTLTTAVLSGRALTVANVGDSAAVLDTGTELVLLTTSHRLDDSPGELRRLQAAGQHLGRRSPATGLPTASPACGIGPVRLWPGGLTLSRAIGDPDLAEHLLPHPTITQVVVPPSGARLILASDGLWDAVPAARLAQALRTAPSPQAAAELAAELALRGQFLGAQDDISVFVVDLLPPVAASFADVCAAQRSRMLGSTSSGTRSRSSASSYLSSPSSGPRHASNRTVGTPGSLRRRLGLFSCFRAVAEDEEGQEEAEVAAGAALEQVPCPPEPAGSEASGAATTNQQQEPAGPELPVVRVSESKSLHVLADEDTATWTPMYFMRRTCGSGSGRGGDSASLASMSPRSPHAPGSPMPDSPCDNLPSAGAAPAAPVAPHPPACPTACQESPAPPPTPEQRPSPPGASSLRTPDADQAFAAAAPTPLPLLPSPEDDLVSAFAASAAVGFFDDDGEDDRTARLEAMDSPRSAALSNSLTSSLLLRRTLSGSLTTSLGNCSSLVKALSRGSVEQEPGASALSAKAGGRAKRRVA